MSVPPAPSPLRGVTVDAAPERLGSPPSTIRSPRRSTPSFGVGLTATAAPSARSRIGSCAWSWPCCHRRPFDDDWPLLPVDETLLPLASPAPPARLRVDRAASYFEALFDQRGVIQQTVSGRYPELRPVGGSWTDTFHVHGWEVAMRHLVQRIRFRDGSPAVGRPV